MEVATAASGRKIYDTTLISHVSYLAQTRKFASVILCSPECVDWAADADSQLSFRRSLRAGS